MTTAVLRLANALGDRYRIERELGQGGMATVYLAQDLRHDRKVAIKVLRPELSAVIGAERFLREIKTIAGLQHPHILGLIDSGETDGTAFYVMPFVEGESLRDRLRREKQLPIADAVGLAGEVAAALDYAHRNGIIHRDIKPENVLLHEGRALVADFGIALAMTSASGTRMTETGMSLGTPHYMSPEQAMGEREITARSDVYALGCVLYEMLVGEPPFTGPTAQAIVAKVMTDEPRPPTELRKTVPSGIEAVVLTALAKLPADRFASAAAFSDALRQPGFESATLARPRTRERRAESRPVLWTLGGLALGAVVTGVLLQAREQPPPEPVTLQFVPPDDVRLLTSSRRADFAISPDGTTLVFAGVSQQDRGPRSSLYARRMADGNISPLRGGERGSSPFFTPDGLTLGFHLGFEMHKVPSEGGVSVAVPIPDSAFVSGVWASDDRILYTAPGYFLKTFSTSRNETGILARPLPTDRGGPWLAFPLPSHRGVLYRHCSTILADSCTLAVAREDGSVRELGIAALQGWYLPTGHLAYVRADGTMMGVGFDLSRLEVTGEAVPLLEGVSLTPDDAPNLAWSRSGTLAYVSGNQTASSSLVTISSAGVATPISTRTGLYWSPRASPDGGSIALLSLPAGAGRSRQLWVFDRRSGTPRPIVTGRAVYAFAWSPDGKELALVADALIGIGTLRRGLYRIPADGSDTLRAIPLPDGIGSLGAGLDWSPDGRWLVAAPQQGPTPDLVAIAADGSGAWQLLAGSPASEHSGMVSPDGTRLAYISNESGVEELYVRPFLRPGPAVPLGTRTPPQSPRWGHDGRAVYYMEGDSAAVLELTSGLPAVVTGRRTLSSVTGVLGGSRSFAPWSEGPELLAIQRTEKPAILTVVLNWFTDVRRKMASTTR